MQRKLLVHHYLQTVDYLHPDNIENLKALEEPTIQSFVIESMNLVDTIVKGDEFLEEKLDKAFEESKTPKNEYVDGGSISEIY